MFNIHGSEWFIIGALLFIILGPQKLPGFARSVGRWTTQIKSTLKDAQDEIFKDMSPVDVSDDPPLIIETNADIRAREEKSKPAPAEDNPRDLIPYEKNNQE